jgi:polyisoprenoid-binding protein YceI
MTTKALRCPLLCAALLSASGTIDELRAQDVWRWTVAPRENEARYRVREQLARINFPSDAVGVTTAIAGGIAVDAQGAVQRAQSRFTIDVAGLKSDSDRRDNFLRRNTLQAEQYPAIVFEPAVLHNLSFPLPASGDLDFQMVGDMTIRGVTRPVTWDVTAVVVDGALKGLARTRFTFADFGITKPRVASVLSVDDDIRLEYSFLLVPARE